MVSTGIRVGNFLRAGPFFTIALVPLYFLRLVVLALFALTWGVNAGLAFALLEHVGANQPAEVNATFVRYQRQPKSLCRQQAVFATSLGEIALCVDGDASKIRPRFPVDAVLAPGDLVVLSGVKNRFVFIPQTATRSMASAPDHAQAPGNAIMFKN